MKSVIPSDCHGLPWITTDWYGLPWIPLDSHKRDLWILRISRYMLTQNTAKKLRSCTSALPNAANSKHWRA
ncbi:MAG: hypothetical protein ABI402_17505 [Ferruginibacter sp.]